MWPGSLQDSVRIASGYVRIASGYFRIFQDISG
jgi:hypothetical protein